MIQIYRETIQTEKAVHTDRKGKSHSYDRTTIEISINGDRRRVRCYCDPRSITIYGLAVRFRTGSKVWPGSATYWIESGNINHLRPNIDKFSGQFCTLLGFFEDYDESQSRSQHNAVA